MPLQYAPLPDETGDQPSDDFLLASAQAGDEAAFRKLVARYDRLVRYTIYRTSKTQCLTDPQWLDSIASSTWSGFVETMRRAVDPLRRVGGLLATIARRQAISAIRARNPSPTQLDKGNADIYLVSTDDPSHSLADLELLEAIRSCTSQLDPDDQSVLSQMTLLLDRRWTDAAAALGTSESTLRYRWARILGRLRECVEGKTGHAFAPDAPSGDY